MNLVEMFSYYGAWITFGSFGLALAYLCLPASVKTKVWAAIEILRKYRILK